MKTKRMAAVISHPIQHFAPMFRALAGSGDLALKVIYACDWGTREYRDPGFDHDVRWDIPLLEGYDHEFLHLRRRPRALGFFDIDNPDVAARLDEFRPEAVWIHGYAHRTSWRVRRWAIRNGARMIFFGDSELLHKRSLPSRLVKRLLLPWFYRPIQSFITIGDNNEAYYRHYGVPASRFHRGAYPVDIGRFQATIAAMTGERRAAWRERFGLQPGATVVLFSGKFIPIKRPMDLIDAVALTRSPPSALQALFIGTGPLEKELRRHVTSAGLDAQVRFAGFINQREMPEVLSLGHVLVMASEVDPHPLAVSEAMAAGCAIVASDRVGCTGPTDAARPGLNAVAYPCGQVAELARILGHLADHRDELDGLRDHSRCLAPTQDVSAAVAAVRSALGLPSPESLRS